MKLRTNLLLLFFYLTIDVVSADGEIPSTTAIDTLDIATLTDAQILALRNRIKLLDLYESNEDETLLALAGLLNNSEVQANNG